MSVHVTPVYTGERRKTFFLRRIIARWLKENLPRSVKRQIFLLSISAILRYELKSHKDQVKRLNRILGLTYSTNVNALMFPMYISGWIWRGIEVESNSETSPLYNFREITKCHMGEDELKLLTQMIKRHAPKWLIYASDTLIAYDLKMLFETIEEIEPC